MCIRARKCSHKTNCNRGHRSKVYQTIRDNGGWDMKPIEEFNATKRQAEVREQYWMDIYKPMLNSMNAYGKVLSSSEACQKHREAKKKQKEFIPYP